MLTIIDHELLLLLYLFTWFLRSEIAPLETPTLQHGRRLRAGAQFGCYQIA